jgi:hypothetical protein
VLKQWRRFELDVGADTLAIAAEDVEPNSGHYSDVAIALMVKMGWVKGQGIGKHSQGTPYPPLATGQTNNEGLGYGKPCTPTNQPKSNPLLGFENESGEHFYGYKGERNGQQVLEEVRCTGRGLLVHTGRTIPTPFNHERGVPEDLSEALMWDGGPVGLQYSTYPHPQGWTLRGAEHGQTLEHMTIKTLTAIHRNNYANPPTCVTNWPAALGHDVPVEAAFANHSNPILTKRDSKSHFRILHRSLFTRNLGPHPQATNEASPNDEHLACRLCLVESEHFSHIAKCYITRQVFAPLAALANLFMPIALDEALINIGAISTRQTLPPGLAVLHTVLWKFFLIDFTRVDTDKLKFEPARPWRAAVLRVDRKLRARHTFLVQQARDAADLGKPPPPLTSEPHAIPLVAITSSENLEITLTPHPEWERTVKEASSPTRPP